ncbi:hypothetical protein Slin15195_G086750 [Septoria linicola]|uniref:Uncharacterized protein n=1 Tax=Septoria linicola TaxID=215465 RepID=A0A9Q9B135_9PEZI|nr:hypothetical protein Slin14017_G089340 [Septoria linicola]USW55356.1 hypothetical protein Slin15195_G086750 [Septoria linicola]
MGVADLQDRLGFKYTTSIWFKALDTLPQELREFRASIDALVTEPEHLTQAKAKESHLLRRRCNEVLVRLGPVLWPNGARLRHDCPQWLTFAPESGYGTDLFWYKREHQTRIRGIFFKLVVQRIKIAQARRNKALGEDATRGLPSAPTPSLLTPAASMHTCPDDHKNAAQSLQIATGLTAPGHSRHQRLDAQLTKSMTEQGMMTVQVAPMYFSPKPRLETVSHIECSILRPSSGSPPDSPLIIEEEKSDAAEDLNVDTHSRRLDTARPVRTDLLNKVAPRYAATVVKSEPRGEVQESTKCTVAGRDTSPSPTSKTPAVLFPNTSAVLATETSQQRPFPECAYVRVDWGFPQQDIIGIPPSTTIADFRKRIGQYQQMHKRLKAKVVAAMIVRNVQTPDFRIVWDDDLGQSGLGELQALMLSGKGDRQVRIEMKAEREEQSERGGC